VKAMDLQRFIIALLRRVRQGVSEKRARFAEKGRKLLKGLADFPGEGYNGAYGWNTGNFPAAG